MTRVAPNRPGGKRSVSLIGDFPGYGLRIVPRLPGRFD